MGLAVRIQLVEAMGSMMPLKHRVARIIDPVSFELTPASYGLKTQKEFERTWAFSAQEIALSKAATIIHLVKAECE